MEDHLKQECPQRLVNCKDCGKEMYFIELQVCSVKTHSVFYVFNAHRNIVESVPMLQQLVRIVKGKYQHPR